MFKGRSDGRSRRIDTLIGKGGRIQGDLEFQGGLHLDGNVAGSVRATPAPPPTASADATLSVSDSGRVDGSVVVPNVILDGAVRGDIFATGRVVLGPRSRVEGNVVYGSIEMAAGAEVQGKLMPQASLQGGPRGPRSGVIEGTHLATAGTNAVESLQPPPQGEAVDDRSLI